MDDLPLGKDKNHFCNPPELSDVNRSSVMPPSIISCFKNEKQTLRDMTVSLEPVMTAQAYNYHRLFQITTWPFQV